MRDLLIFILLSYTLPLHAQSVTDSLDLVLQQDTLSSTQRIKTLNRLSEETLGSDSLTFLSANERAILLSDTYEYTEGLVDAQILKATYLQKKGRYEEALELCSRAINTAKTHQYMKGLISSLSKNGEVLNKVGSFKEALASLRQAYILADALDDFKALASISNITGISYYRLGQLDSAIIYYQAALTSQNKLSDSLDIAGAQINLGGAYYKKGDFKNALSQFKSATDIASSLNNNTYYAAAINNRGLIYWRLGNYDKATADFEESLALAEANDNKPTMAFCLANLGIIAQERANYPASLEFYLKAVQMRKEMQDSAGLATSYYNLGLLFKEWKDDSMAFSYYDKSLQLRKTIGDLDGQASVYNSLGEFFYDNKQYKKSQNAFKKALVLNQKIGNKTKAIETYLRTGKLYLITDKMDSAFYFLQKSLSLSQEVGLQSLGAEANFAIGEYYQKSNNYIKALNYLKKSLHFAQQEHLKELESKCHKLLSEVYMQKGDYKNAYASLQNHVILKDSIFSDEIIRKTSRIEASYAFQREKDSLNFERQREQMAYESEIQQEKDRRQWLFLVIFIIVVLAGILAYLLLDKFKKNEVLLKQKEDLDKALSINNRFFSIVSHDLRGFVLDFISISGILLHYTKTKKMDQILDLGSNMKRSSQNMLHLLDNLLHWSLTKEYKFPLKKNRVALNDILTETVELFKTSAENKSISIKFQTEPDLYIRGDENGLKTAFRNIVNNALKFSEPGKAINVKACTTNNKVIIEIADQGVGMSIEKLDELRELKATPIAGTRNEKGVGLGMRLIVEFVQRNEGELHIGSHLGVGTTISLSFNQLIINRPAKKHEHTESIDY
ncbi:tetratricopeptide repeat protein [Fulvivirga maritima]|uniref:tetratricopeptide repeat protein n=1 Tax=Fulvivirga maritima TaxID=2904247 RepID=UPI001F3AECF5|nr:tetratricopeptide repeat protein [Fulvivirga maritima]UII25865.1 tetratricopeptide repeat protein [Fulvivirga maritima]